MPGLSKSFNLVLLDFIEGEYEGNRARVALALKGVGLDEQDAALDYVRGIQTPHTERRDELVGMLLSSRMYTAVDEVIGSKDKPKLGFTAEWLKRAADERKS